MKVRFLPLLITLLPAALVLADGLVARWCIEYGIGDVNVLELLLVALHASQVGLLAIWCALSRRGWYVRLPVTLLGLTLLGVTLSLGIDVASGFGSRSTLRTTMLLTLVPAVAVGVAVWVLRYFKRRYRAGERSLAIPKVQFSVGHLVLAVTGIGIAFGVVRWWTLGSESHDRVLVFAGAGLWLLLYLVITLAALWAAFGGKRPLLRSALVIVATPFGALGWARLLSSWDMEIIRSPIALILPALVVMVAAVHVLVVLVVLMLVRLERHYAGRIAGPQSPAPMSGRRFAAMLVAAAGVAAVTIGPPSYRLWKRIQLAEALGGVRWERQKIVAVTIPRRLYDGEVGDDALKYVTGIASLERLSVGESKLTDAGLSQLAALARLEEIDFDPSAITDEGLRHLSRLTRLRRLDLSGSKMSDDGLRNLAGLTRLELLDLSGTDITDAGLVHLESLRRLTQLNLDDCAVTDAGMAHLKPLRALREISLRRTRVTAQGVTMLGKTVPVEIKGVFGGPDREAVAEIQAKGGVVLIVNDRVQTVHIGGSRYGEGGAAAALGHLRDLSAIPELSVALVDLSDAHREELAAIEKVSKFDLTVHSITLNGMSNLGELSNVTGLQINGLGITDESLEHLKNMTNLTELSLAGRAFTDEGLDVLREMPGLRELDLGDEENNLSDAALQHVAELNALESLDFSHLPFTDAGLVHLRQLSHLKSLDLSGTKVTDDGLAHLKGLTNLKTLHVADTKVTGAAAAQLKSALPELRIER